MNDNDLKMGSNNEHTYRATANLNTAIENPQVSMESMMGVNIYNSDTDINNGYINNEAKLNAFDNNLDFLDDQVVKNSQNLSNFEESSFNGVMSQENKQVNDTDSQSKAMSNEVGSRFISNDVQNAFKNIENNLNSEMYGVSNDDKVTYKPIMKQKKKPRVGLEISKQVKMMMVIIFILLLFLFVIPYIYDFFHGL